MADKQINDLLIFKKKDKFSPAIWEVKGLNPSDFELCQNLNLIFNSIVDNLINALNSNSTNRQLKSILIEGIKKFNKHEYDTEEKEIICDIFYEMSNIVNIDFKSNLNKWLYGSVLNTFFQLSKLLRSQKAVETIMQPCSKCGSQLESYIIQKQEGIPDSSWLIVKCDSCKEFNLLSTGINIKELRHGNYQWIETLSKNEYSSEQASIRLEQIKFFRK